MAAVCGPGVFLAVKDTVDGQHHLNKVCVLRNMPLFLGNIHKGVYPQESQKNKCIHTSRHTVG